MTYWTLNAIFLAPVAGVAVLATVRSRRRQGAATPAGPASRNGAASGGSVCWRAVAISAVILLLLTAVFDNLMISAGLFGYNPDKISGAFIGLAPLEDFAYTAAAVVLLPVLWSLFARRTTGESE